MRLNLFKQKKDQGDAPIKDERLEVLTRINSADILCDKSYFKLFEIVAVLSVILICALGLKILLLSNSRPDVRFFLQKPNGQVLSVRAIGNDHSAMPKALAQTFIANALPQAMSFDFNNYQYVLNEVMPRFFTDKAAHELRAIIKARYIKQMLSDKEFYSLSVVKSYVFNTNKLRNEWWVQVPANFSIYNGRKLHSAVFNVQLDIAYTGTTKNPYGLEIKHLEVAPQ